MRCRSRHRESAEMDQPETEKRSLPIPATSAARISEVRALAAQLSDAMMLNTWRTRAQCRVIMRRVLLLLDEEDAWQLVHQGEQDEELSESAQRLRDALTLCREAGEQLELTRLYVKSELLE